MGITPMQLRKSVDSKLSFQFIPETESVARNKPI